MFNFLKKSKTAICPVSGNVVNISKVSDDVFCEKILGDGIFISPSDNSIFSPVDATITRVFKHMIALKSNDDLEIIIHLGLDYNNDFNNMITTFCYEGQSVLKSEKLMTFDLELMKSNNLSPVCCVLIPNSDKLKKYSLYYGNLKSNKDIFIKYR